LVDEKSVVNVFEELDKKEKVKLNEVIDALSRRILVMKRNKRSDYEINEMINQTKSKYEKRLLKGDITSISEFNSDEQAKFHDLGKGGQVMIKDDRDVLDYSAELQRSPDIYEDVKRKLRALDDNIMGKSPKVHTFPDQSKFAHKKTMLKDKPDSDEEVRMLKEERAKAAAKKEARKAAKLQEQQKLRAEKMRNRNLYSNADGENYSDISNTFDTTSQKLIRQQESAMRSIHSPINSKYSHSKHTMAEARKNTIYDRRRLEEKKEGKNKEKKVTSIYL